MNQPYHISKKMAKRHQRKLKELLAGFFSLLDSQPKPDRETIRTEFIKAESEWRVYCLQNSLGTLASEYFNMKVSYEWETRYAKGSQ